MNGATVGWFGFVNPKITDCAGFKKAWQEHDYAIIITVADKISENILQEDPKLLMWYDQALTRSGEHE